MNLKDCSLLIQGPAHHHSMITMDYAKNFFGEIVYSTYPLEDKLYDFAVDNNYLDDGDIKLLINNLEANKEVLPDNIALSQQNFHKQVLSTFSGLKQCTKKYVLKMRSDEYYLGIKNIDAFIKEDKVNFINVFFRHFSKFPYHPSDHMFLAERTLMADTFDFLYNACYVDFENFTETTCQEPNVQLFAEQALCLAFLYNLTKSKIPFRNASTNHWLFHKFFHIFTAKSIGPYCISARRGPHHEGKQFVTDLEHSHLKLKNDCNSMEQYK